MSDFLKHYLSTIELYTIAQVCNEKKRKLDKELEDMMDKLAGYGFKKPELEAIRHSPLQDTVIAGILAIKDDEDTYKRKYEKLQKKHQKASQMIAELKNNRSNDKKTALAISTLVFELLKNSGYQADYLSLKSYGNISIISAINKGNTLLLKIQIKIPLNLKNDIEFIVKRDNAGNAYIQEYPIPMVMIPSDFDKFNYELFNDSNYIAYNYDTLNWNIKSFEKPDWDNTVVAYLGGKTTILNLCLFKQGLLFEPTNDEIYFKLRKDNHPLMFKYSNCNFTVYGVLAPKVANINNFEQASILNLNKR